MWWTTSEQALSFLAHKLRIQDRRGQVLMSLAYHKAHVQEKGYADSLILAFLRGIKRTLWKLHVQFSWLKNKHKKQWTASGSVTLTLSWLSYTPVPALPQPTLFLTLCCQCVGFFFPSGLQLQTGSPPVPSHNPWDTTCECPWTSPFWLNMKAGKDQRTLAKKNFWTSRYWGRAQAPCPWAARHLETQTQACCDTFNL